MSAQSQALLVGGRRTPVGKYGGALSSVRPDDLAALTIKAVIEDAGIDPSVVDEVILGNANGAGEENRNVARMAWLLAGFPDTVPGITVNRLCASGMSAIGIATAMVRSGMADVVVAGGVESMSRAPWVMEKPAKAFAKPGDVFDTSIGWRFTNPEFKKQDKMTYSMPETAEEVAIVDGISREDADAFAVASHEKAIAAIDACFERLDAHRVFARLDALNHSSIKVCERIGMRLEATLRESHRQLGEWRDELIYAILADEA